MSESARADQLAFVLPVALKDTGRPGSDAERVALLLESFLRCFPLAQVSDLLLITPTADVDTLYAVLRQLGNPRGGPGAERDRGLPRTGLGSADISVLSHDEQGLVRQQLLKLGACRYVRTDFYMTLDSDVIFTRPFTPDTVVRQRRSLVNTHTVDDFLVLYTDGAAAGERRGQTGSGPTSGADPGSVED